MKILITGGAGFIGSNFVCYALQQGYHIINVDKLTYAGHLENLFGVSNHKNYHYYREDICHKDHIEQIILKHQPKIIVHMAAESHVDRSIKCANDFIQTNIVGTHTLLQASLHYYKKIKNDLLFIHLSTDEVFGSLGLDGKFNENSPYRPNSPYAASKASSDLLARSYYKTYGLPLIIIHPSNNYGPQQYPEKFIPLMILNALNHKTLPLYGNGLQIRDWLYVEDHVKALHTIILQGKIGESYCISAGNEITNLNLAKTLCTLLDHMHPSATLKSYKNLITFVTDRPGHDFRYATDASKLKRHTQWQPQTEFQEGLKKTIQWYINHKLEFSRVCLQNQNES